MSEYLYRRGYHVFDVLGEGGFATVFKCTKGKAVLALKEIEIDRSMPLDTAEYEAKYMKRLGFHKNILLRVDQCTGSADERTESEGSGPPLVSYFITTEYCLCTVRELQHFKVQFHLPDIKAMFHQMLEGLDYIHSKGIMHRDIKPDNIFLSADGLLKIADFGLALFVDEQIRPSKYRGYIAGTVYYMPPEMLLYKGQDTKMDIWALGCVFAEMCIGQPLFKPAIGSPIFQRCKLQNQMNMILWRCTNASFTNPLIESMQYPKQPEKKVLNFFKGKVNRHIAALLNKMLIMDPKKRPTAGALLKKSLFKGSAPDIKATSYSYLLKMYSDQFLATYFGSV